MVSRAALTFKGSCMPEIAKAPSRRGRTNATAGVQLDTEVANRLRDPFETLFSGIVRTNDPLLLERGAGGSAAFDLYRDLKRDGAVFKALQKRKLALISRPIQVEPVEDSEAARADAEIVSDILKRIQFDKLCDEMLDALLAGFVPHEVVWTVGDGYFVPKRLVKRAQRRFTFVQVDEHQPPELRLLTRENMLTGEALPARKFFVHRVNPEDDNPYGTGLGLQLFWPVFFKRKGIIAWNKLCDRFGSPTPVGKYPKGSGPKEKSTLFDALKAMSNDGVVVMPEGMSVELLESKLTGSITTQQALCEYMDDWIDGVLLGTESRSKGGGALAAASKERQDVRLDLVQADSDLLSDTLDSSLILWICEVNGLAPCKVSRVIKEEEDLKAQSETDKNVAGLGFELSEEAVRSRYGEGWSRKAEPKPSTTTGLPVVDNKKGAAANDEQAAAQAAETAANFAEASALQSGQIAIDNALQAIDDTELQAAMADLMGPLLDAIDGATSFEEALAAAEAAYPRMDNARLQSLLARAMFGAETFGRASDA